MNPKDGFHKNKTWNKKTTKLWVKQIPTWACRNVFDEWEEPEVSFFKILHSFVLLQLKMKRKKKKFYNAGL